MKPVVQCARQSQTLRQYFDNQIIIKELNMSTLDILNLLVTLDVSPAEFLQAFKKKSQAFPQLSKALSLISTAMSLWSRDGDLSESDAESLKLTSESLKRQLLGHIFSQELLDAFFNKDASSVLLQLTSYITSQRSFDYAEVCQTPSFSDSDLNKLLCILGVPEQHSPRAAAACNLLLAGSTLLQNMDAFRHRESEVILKILLGRGM